VVIYLLNCTGYTESKDKIIASDKSRKIRIDSVVNYTYVRLEDVRTENEKTLGNGQASQLLNLEMNTDVLNMKQRDCPSVAALSCLDQCWHVLTSFSTVPGSI
jgi:hypothetical protein